MASLQVFWPGPHLQRSVPPSVSAAVAMAAVGEKRVCSFFLQGQCHKMDDPGHLDAYWHGDEADDPPAFAFDCEFISVMRVDGTGQPVDEQNNRIDRASAYFRWPVSIGLVDQRMETLLYTRVRKPLGSHCGLGCCP
mmetsp:Transcript_43260/g.138993  ORF Transcript_43260/g.138993 Transcript_43260/m.138993 type:complete len:137 (+) Transcript_43260:65-475(+)